MLDSDNHLRSPFELTKLPLKSAQLTARCAKGHQPPNALCFCGIHYFLSPRDMFRYIESGRRVASVRPGRFLMHDLNFATHFAVTRGIASGLSLPDRFGSVGGRRASQYTATQMWVGGALASHRIDALATNYGLPVISGIGWDIG